MRGTTPPSIPTATGIESDNAAPASRGHVVPLSFRRAVAPVSRRAIMVGAVGLGAAMASGAPHAAVSRAQEAPSAASPATLATPMADATPTAASAEATPEGSILKPRRGGKIALVRPGGSISNFNPSAFAQDPQIPLSYLEPLVRPDPRTLEPRPWLAREWSWSEEGLQLTLTIRDNVTWHDGQPLTAADAAFSYLVYQRDIDSAVSGLFDLVESVEAASERQIVVRFVAADGAWLFNAATLPIFSRRQYEPFWSAQPEEQRSLSRFDWNASRPVGTGPWRIVDWAENRIELARFDHYWDEPAWLDALVLTVEQAAQQRFRAWESGKSQLLWPVPAHAIDAAGGSPDRQVTAPAASVMFAAFNFANPDQPNGSLWSDLRVRQAASLAIDRDRYAIEVFGGRIQALAAGTVAQPWAHASAITSPQLNREAASILLGDAGWLDYDGDGIREDASGVPLRPVVIVRDDMSPELVAVLGRVARDLAEIGMALTVDVLSADAFDSRWIESRTYDLIAYAYDLLPGFTDFDLYGSAWDVRVNPAGWNPGGYSNGDADAAIAEYLGAISIARQRAALAKLQQAVNDDLFGLWLGFPDDLILVADSVAGFEPDMAWQTSQTAKLWLRADTVK